jgi:hypothetical protein
MQLGNARLCLDCEEVHDAAHCPMCASESFAFITRWVPSPSGEASPAGGAPVPAARAPRERPLQAPPVEPVRQEAVDTYRQLLSGTPPPNANWRFVKRGALGLAIFGLAGWAWKQQNQRAGASPRDDQQQPDRD